MVQLRVLLMANPITNQPRVSIVVPSYNQAQFIGRTLESILSQDYPIEVIVIDGGSSDETVDIIQSFGDRITYWVSEPDRGQTHAINKGMARATGDIRAYLNSDDIYLPGAVRAVVEAFQANPDADILHGRCVTIDEDDNRLDREFYSDIETPSDVLDLWHVWFRGRNFVQPEVFWTKRIAEKVGPFDEFRHYAMDYDYWTRCIIAGAKVYHIDREISAFRIWAAQKSSAAEKAADELRDIAIAHINDRSVEIPASLRRQLKGDWAFDEIFSKSAGSIGEAAGGSLERRARLARLVCSNPSLLVSRSFKRHASRIANRWLS